mmetsp:Transcript_163265/g.301496  ORF Transcript_163265/g.301496 Transcript_163265/m.301496 type:complete len:718 (-) Transcript_163265:8-2161(-)
MADDELRSLTPEAESSEEKEEPSTAPENNSCPVACPMAVETPGSAQKPGVQHSCGGTLPPATSSSKIPEKLDLIEREARRWQPWKETVQQILVKAIQDYGTESIRHCRLEVVGSTSWGCEVPMSDLDLMLIAHEDSDNTELPLPRLDAVPALESLQRCLEAFERSGQSRHGLPWKRMELLEAPRVPILRLYGNLGDQSAPPHCDVTFDQPHVLEHRKFLLEAIEKRPELRHFVRLVKHWARLRGLPPASEGGLPSLAWGVAALRLAAQQPEGTSVEVLLLYFFSEMSKLGEYALRVRQRGEVQWKPRGSQPHQLAAAWTEEWIQLLSVDDPVNAAADDMSQKTIPPLRLTPSSIPTALALLYVAELKLAWNTLQQDRWDEFWRAAPCDAKAGLPVALTTGKSSEQSLHLVIHNQVVRIASLRSVAPPRVSGLPPGAWMHRRDQTACLQMQECGLQPNQSAGTWQPRLLADQRLSVHPCHWVCMLSARSSDPIDIDGLARLGEIAKLVGMHSISPGILAAAIAGGAFGAAPQASPQQVYWYVVPTHMQQFTNGEMLGKVAPEKVNREMNHAKGYGAKNSESLLKKGAHRNQNQNRRVLNGKPPQDKVEDWFTTRQNLPRKVKKACEDKKEVRSQSLDSTRASEDSEGSLSTAAVSTTDAAAPCMAVAPRFLTTVCDDALESEVSNPAEPQEDSAVAAPDSAWHPSLHHGRLQPCSTDD